MTISNAKFGVRKVERREISEIAHRLRFEPQIREMYVEGIFDRDFYRGALKAMGINDVQVYPIETINVPNELVAGKGLTAGDRQRVQTAASELEKFKEIHHQVLLLVDADLDYLLDQPLPTRPLAWTDGTATELVFWNKSSLERFFEVGLARQDAKSKVSTVMPFVESIVSQVFLFRAAKQRAGKDWKQVDISETFSAKRDFCLETYCEKIAARNGKHKEMKDELMPIIACLSERAAQLTINKKMHAHDLLAVLAKKLQLEGFAHGCLGDPDELSRLIMVSLEWAMLISEPTLSALYKSFPPANANVTGAFPTN